MFLPQTQRYPLSFCFAGGGDGHSCGGSTFITSPRDSSHVGVRRGGGGGGGGGGAGGFLSLSLILLTLFLLGLLGRQSASVFHQSETPTHLLNVRDVWSLRTAPMILPTSSHHRTSPTAGRGLWQVPSMSRPVPRFLRTYRTKSTRSESQMQRTRLPPQTANTRDAWPKCSSLLERCQTPSVRRMSLDAYPICCNCCTSNSNNKRSFPQSATTSSTLFGDPVRGLKHSRMLF